MTSSAALKLNLVSEIKENYRLNVDSKLGAKMNNKVEIWFCPLDFNYIGTARFKRNTALRMRTKEYDESSRL